jgi:hypothetical protein
MFDIDAPKAVARCTIDGNERGQGWPAHCSYLGRCFFRHPGAMPDRVESVVG